MENPNAEKVKKALEIHTGILDKACEECPYNRDAHDEICLDVLVVDTLALITSQEQRIKELTEENERLITAIPLWAKQCVELEERCMALRAEVSVKKKLLDKAEETIAKERAKTVREMQERLKECFDNEIEHKSIYTESQVLFVINQIAKEVLEGKNEIKTNSEHS